MFETLVLTHHLGLIGLNGQDLTHSPELNHVVKYYSDCELASHLHCSWLVSTQWLQSTVCATCLVGLLTILSDAMLTSSPSTEISFLYHVAK